MSNAEEIVEEIVRRENRNWMYLLAGAALVAGGIVMLSRIESYHRTTEDPIADAQRMLSRAQSKISEIEAGLQSSRQSQPA
jgi:hypothetical protein